MSGSPECSVGWILGERSLPAHVDPQAIALRWGEQSLSYSELRERALALARALRARGLERGDRVAAHFLNRGETFELYFACAYAGLTLVPVNFRMTAHEIGLVLSDCRPGLMFSQAELAETARAGVEAFPELELVVLEDDEPGASYSELFTGPPLEELDHTAIALILYTSGTTGKPKGVMLSHTNAFWFALQQAALFPDLGPDSVTLLTGPTYNTAAINEQSIPTFFVGGTVAIHPSRGWRPERTAELVERWRVTHTIIYPSMMEPFLEADREQRLELASLRFVLTGGENCPPATIERFRRRWSHVSLCVAYGLTEVGAITWILDDEIDRHVGSVGRAFGGQSFRVLRPDGTEADVDECGEICAKGPAVVSGYWNAPELTAATLRDGWLWTGDLGRVDVDGYLYLEGRSRDLIISKGQNIYPAEIENVIAEHDAVAEVSVVGVGDEEFGEAVCAVVVPRAGAAVSEAEIVACAVERLASYKKPRYVVFLETLPRSPGGKVMKAELAELVSERVVTS